MIHNYFDRFRLVWLCSVLFALLTLYSPGAKVASAHEGPPYPIIMDAPHGPYKVSIWADPDIGEALFYVLVESLQNPEIKVDAEVTLWTRPTSNRLEKAIYQGELQPLRGRTQYVIKSHFDQQDFWNVGVDITGNGKTNEVTFEIESTPDGYGIWDLAIYLFPFALLGGLWIRALFHRHKDIDDESGGGHDQTGEAVQEMSTS